MYQGIQEKAKAHPEFLHEDSVIAAECSD